MKEMDKSDNTAERKLRCPRWTHSWTVSRHFPSWWQNFGWGQLKEHFENMHEKGTETLLALTLITRCVILPTALTDHALSILKALTDTTRTTWKKAWKRAIKAEGDCYLATGKCDQFSMTKLDKEEIQQVALSQGICTSIPSRTKKHWKSGDLELTR